MVFVCQTHDDGPSPPCNEQVFHSILRDCLPDTALIEKESVKHFALADSQPQVIHVQVLHVKEMQSGEMQT